mgnify:CR=1 FL=1
MKNLFEQSRSHWVRYDHYELKTAEDGKRYITPGKSAKPDVYNPLKEVPNIVLDALNVGMLMMGRKPEAEVEKAIMESDIGIHPSNDGKCIRLLFPELTEERRKDLVKTARKIAEDAKVAIRSIRRDGNDEINKMKKKNEITEDDVKDLEKDMQKVTDDHIKQIDKILADKEKEIMQV